MIDRICLFEDQHFRWLLPLVYTRPVYDLRCGMLTLREKVQKHYPGALLQLHARGYLADLLREQNPGTTVNQVGGQGCLFLNGRLVASEELSRQIPLDGPDALYTSGEILVAARLGGKALDALRGGLPEFPGISAFRGIPKTGVSPKIVSYPWDLVNFNGGEIVSDFGLLAPERGQRMRGTVYEGAHLINPENIVIGEGSRVKPGVVLDGETGPIWIGNNVTVFPNAVIEGPAFVGDRSLIKVGAKIYENTSIGPVCKVGGEVEGAVIHSFSNKQHDGFLGHAYLGMWVNLGADTNNSDLKNNYGNVKLVIDGETVDSGSMFMGLVMGDHSKSAINSMFNTGTVVGVSSNVFGSGFPPKSVPSFTWGGGEGLKTYELERALDVARRVMGRRKMVLSPAEEKVLRVVFDLTRKERSPAGAVG
jgi:UDP-N-acetylglucosamine diphosphorylase / glucose-1-phosphate thymidylyltransferase / UDP-N-acetylgalactosamine diphosphorylase / glucosamine-1-phosphate N-acetyltransferase / galactosamine-1-phosphate N-acetyltransferase